MKTFNKISLSFLVIAFFTGIASSFQMPTLSLFLSQEIEVSPFMVGLFYSINSVVAIIISQIVGKYSDYYPNRKFIIVICCLIAALGAVFFALIRNYWILVSLGTFLLALGSSSNPQSFALAREYNEQNKQDSSFFTSLMRAQISLAWIIGPPLSFYIAVNLSFTLMYFIATAAFIVSALISQNFLPNFQKPEKKLKVEKKEIALENKASVLYLFIACFLMWVCNGMYLISMPLYVFKELNLPNTFGGTLMATAAGLEIPIMLLAGFLCRYISKKILMIIAIIAGILFYITILSVDKKLYLISAQLLNGIFIGIVASIGMIYFQDLMKNQMGNATTLFTNSARCSWILGGPLAGFVSQYYNNYYSVFILSLICSIIALLFLLKVRNV